jgi:hypothetical protein
MPLLKVDAVDYAGKNLKFDNFSWFKQTVHAIRKSQIFKVIIFIVP